MEKKYNDIDSFFRESLEGHRVEPSGERREAFLKEAQRITEARKIRRRWNFSLSAGALLVAVGILIFLLTRKGEDQAVPVASVSSTSSSSSSSSSAVAKTTTLSSKGPISPSQTPSSTAKSSTREFGKTSAGKNRPLKLQQVASPEPSASANKSGSTAKSGNDPGSREPESSRAGESAQPSGSTSVPQVPPVPAVPVTTAPEPKVEPAVKDSMNTLPPAPADSAKAVPPPTGNGQEEKKKVPGELKFRLGAQYTAEYMFNTLEGEKFINHAGVEAALGYRRFSVTTGVSISVGKGSNELVVDYNDYLGSYNDLDSISFAWDGNHTALVPTYYMTPTDVWDSLLQTNYSKVVKRYTYLEVPVIIGYEFWQPGKFSLGLRAGPILSVLLGSKQVSSAYDPGKDRVVTMNEITPDRIDLNWQLTAGLSIGYRMSRRTLLELEPMFRYYFNSVYEKPGLSEKPWSVGIRLGIYFDL